MNIDVFCPLATCFCNEMCFKCIALCLITLIANASFTCVLVSPADTTCINSSPIAYPPSSYVLCWCLLWFFILFLLYFSVHVFLSCFCTLVLYLILNFCELSFHLCDDLWIICSFMFVKSPDYSPKDVEEQKLVSVQKRPVHNRPSS